MELMFVLLIVNICVAGEFLYKMCQLIQVQLLKLNTQRVQMHDDSNASGINITLAKYS